MMVPVLSEGGSLPMNHFLLSVAILISKKARTLVLDLSMYKPVVCLGLHYLNTDFFETIIFQVRDFHIAKREEDIGFYAGYVGRRASLMSVQNHFSSICEYFQNHVRS